MSGSCHLSVVRDADINVTRRFRLFQFLRLGRRNWIWDRVGGVHMIKWSIWAFDCEMEENDMDEYTLPVLEPVFRTTAVEQGRNRENQQQKEKQQFKTKLQKKMA